MKNTEIIIKCLDGIDGLKARQKALVKEHTERIKGLQQASALIRHSAANNQLDLNGVGGISLSPEMEELIENPYRGL